MTEKLVIAKPLIENMLLNVNQLQKLLLKNHRRLEPLEPLIQNQTAQSVKRAFNTIY